MMIGIIAIATGSFILGYIVGLLIGFHVSNFGKGGNYGS